MRAKTRTDTEIRYASIEDEYRAGVVPISVLAKRIGVSRAAVGKYFTSRGILRNLKDQIRTAAEQKAARALLIRDVADKPLSDDEIVDAVSDVVMAITMKQRERINRYVALSEELYREQLEQTINIDDLRRLGDLMENPDEKGMDRLNEIYKKIIATPTRVDSFRKLTESFKTLIGIERQAYNISDNANGDSDKNVESIESILLAARERGAKA